MSYKLIVGSAVTLLLMAWVTSTHAATIHIRYFESVDILLLDGNRFQFFSVAPLEGELVTIVAYGLDEGVVPGVTLLNPDGSILQENLNPQKQPVIHIQFTAAQTGMYVFMVSRQGESAGLIRVMVTEGEALDENITLIDTTDVLQPSRAFIIAGDSENPVNLAAETLQPEGDEGEPSLPKIYASRGDTLTIPPSSERYTAVERSSWINDNGNIFYILNIRPIPETDFRNLNAEPTVTAQEYKVFDFLVHVRNGSEEWVRVDRPICTETILRATEVSRSGPGAAYQSTGILVEGAKIEIVGKNSDGSWLQIVDGNRPIGHSWIPSHEVYNLTRPECWRVGESYFPLPLRDNTLLRNLLNPSQIGNLIISLEFSCDQTDSFTLAYAAIQDGLGTLLPNIEFVLGTLQTISCSSTAQETEAGNGTPGGNGEAGASGGEGGNEDPAIVILQPSPCTSGGSTDLLLMQGSPIGYPDQQTAVNNYSRAGDPNCQQVYGNNQVNAITGGTGNDTMLAYGGDDVLDGGAGDDALNAGTGNDTIIGGTGNDIVDGGADIDTYDATAINDNTVVNLPGGQAVATSGEVDVLVNVENILMGGGDDSILGSGADNLLDGGAGNDTIDGGAGNDTLIGGDGDDSIVTGAGVDSIDGGTGNDTILITGTSEPGDFVTGGAGSNTFRFSAGATGDLSITSNGTDVLDFSPFGVGITLDLALGTPQAVGGGLNLTLAGTFEVVYGTSADDNISGDANANEIHGRAGNDTVDGRGGNDTIYGGSGSDSLEGNTGVDTLYGGSNNTGGLFPNPDVGSDTIIDSGGDSGDRIFGGNRNFGSEGDDGNDSILDTGGDNDLIYGGNNNGGAAGAVGSDGNDTITDQGGGNDTIFGGNYNSGGSNNDGNDTINMDGGGSGDVIYGGNDNFGVNGDDGSDEINDGGGDDTINGGNRNDSGFAGPCGPPACPVTGNDTVGGDVINSTDGGDDVIYGDNHNVNPPDATGAGVPDTFNTSGGDTVNEGNQ